MIKFSHLYLNILRRINGKLSFLISFFVSFIQLFFEILWILINNSIFFASFATFFKKTILINIIFDVLPLYIFIYNGTFIPSVYKMYYISIIFK